MTDALDLDLGLDVPAPRPAALGGGLVCPFDQLPWRTVLDLWVPGKAAPQGSKMARPIFRGPAGAKVFTGKVAQVESSKSGVQDWRGYVRDACLAAWVDEHGAALPPIDGPVRLTIEFVRSRPKSAPKRSTPWATTMPDCSKTIRSTEDAISSAGVWRDDARVVDERAWKRIGSADEAAGARIVIEVPA